jgi:DNA segregation ATPase FtsK/SpoIIIE, S-DNA-T family
MFDNKTILERSYIKEVILIASITLSLFLTIALFTYNPQDPGWSKINSGTNLILNAEGYIGSWVSDFFFSFLGFTAYLLPIFSCYCIISFLKKNADPNLNDKKNTVLSIFAALFIIIPCSAALLSIHSTFSSLLPAGSGGIIGQSIGWHTLIWFNTIGSTLILTSTLTIGYLLFFQLSIINIIDKIGLYCSNLIHREATQSRESVTPSLSKNTEKRPPPQIQASRPSTETPKKETAIQNPIKPVAKKTKRKLNFSTLLNSNPNTKHHLSTDHLENLSVKVEQRFADFNIIAKVVSVSPGPVITRFELQLAPGTKVSKITTLSKDIARSLSVTSVRIVEVISGKSVIGLEIPNKVRSIVYFKDILESEAFKNASSPLSITLGQDITGKSIVSDISKMPHLLVAGTTGSGKSVFINAMILSLICKTDPKHLKMIFIDPKMLELAVYEGIPHLISPVITDMNDATSALNWAVNEMERRYLLMSKLGVRNIDGFNKKVQTSLTMNDPLLNPLSSTEEQLQTLPHILIVADEFADMMMVVGKKAEQLITRLAQKARASGIHLVLATQRPSVDVITGLIKANIPSRISFQVASRIDSRTILDQQGAENLLGSGDMLYLPAGTSISTRIHGAFVSDDEVHKIVHAICADHAEGPQYEPNILKKLPSDSSLNENSDPSIREDDPLFDKAVFIITSSSRASTSSLQRRLRIGYNRAAMLMDSLEAAGIVSPLANNGTREVLAPPPIDLDHSESNSE